MTETMNEKDILRFLTNLKDPKVKNAKKYLLLSSDQTREEAWADLQKWLADKTIGQPQPTSSYTMEQLQEQNFVGVYVARR